MYLSGSVCFPFNLKPVKCHIFAHSVEWIKNVLYFLMSFLLVCSSPAGSPSLLHPPCRQWNHARREHQHHLRGCRLPHAVREVDAGSRGPDARGRHAHRPQRPGADRRAPVQQLHLRCHVDARRDRSHGTDHCERWVLRRTGFENSHQTVAFLWNLNIHGRNLSVFNVLFLYHPRVNNETENLKYSHSFKTPICEMRKKVRLSVLK